MGRLLRPGHLLPPSGPVCSRYLYRYYTGLVCEDVKLCSFVNGCIVELDQRYLISLRLIINIGEEGCELLRCCVYYNLEKSENSFLLHVMCTFQLR